VPKPIRVDQPKQVDPKVSCAGVPPRQLRPKDTLIGAVARLYWMLAGNAILYLLALTIVQQGHRRASTTDVAFFAVVASLILVRYLDIAWLGGATASGKPASLGDWYRYVAWLLPLSLAVWIIARATGWIGFL
jgi:hypothetical protein